MSRDMKHWSFKTFGSVRAKLKNLKRKLEEAKVEARITGSFSECRAIELKLHDIYEKEEIMYRQRSRQEWLKGGRSKYEIFSESSLPSPEEKYYPLSLEKRWHFVYDQ
jgi:hypothetical protein